MHKISKKTGENFRVWKTPRGCGFYGLLLPYIVYMFQGNYQVCRFRIPGIELDDFAATHRESGITYSSVHKQQYHIGTLNSMMYNLAVQSWNHSRVLRGLQDIGTRQSTGR